MASPPGTRPPSLPPGSAEPSQAPASKHPDLPPRPGVRVKGLAACQDETWRGQTRGVWVDLETPSDEQVRDLAAAFPVNPLALEDALQLGHWAKFEVYPEHAFLIFRTLAEPEDVTERTERVSVFWYPDLGSLVTIRNEPVTYLEGVWHEVSGRRNRTPTDILYALLQRGTDTYFAFLDALEDCTDDLERRVFEGKARSEAPGSYATRVFELRHTVIATRRLVSSARENVGGFSRHAAVVSPDQAILLRDVSDHLTRVYDGLDSARDTLASLLEVYLNVQSHRMNEVMKTLTTVSTIFLPLTFLAGVWGMNFEFQPEFKWPLGYAFAWACFLAVGASLALYFKRRGWW